MKRAQPRRIIITFFALCYLLPVTCALLLVACVSGPRSNIVELENKGTMTGAPTPEWLKVYLEKGLSALQEQYPDSYCIIGEESGVNRQFVLAWADAASAQQRIGSLLRNNIATRYNAAITAASQSGADASAMYSQEIDNVLNAVVNVSYSGARREADWWSLRRRYDPDNRDLYTDEYTAWVLYTVPKAELNRQIAFALESGVSADSALYDVTIALARDILLQGYDEGELQSAAAIRKTAADYYDPPGSVTALALEEISLMDEYYIGRAVAALILSNYRLDNGNPALTNYVNLICQTLIINSPKPAAFNGYYAAILDSDEINAFASPGGHIYITRGLIAAAKSEDALAAVIAHEIAHVLLGHGLRAIQSNRDLEDWMGQFTMSGARTIRDSLATGFSRVQEFDADIFAISLLAASGYNPQGLLEILRELENIQGRRIGGFNDTHPSPTSRLVNAAVAVARYANLADNSGVRRERFDAVVGR